MAFELSSVVNEITMRKERCMFGLMGQEKNIKEIETREEKKWSWVLRAKKK